jgi:hypothetical protein
MARLVPTVPTTEQPGIVEVIGAMRNFQEQEAPSLGDDLSIRDLIDEGRRFSGSLEPRLGRTVKTADAPATPSCSL